MITVPAGGDARRLPLSGASFDPSGEGVVGDHAVAVDVEHSVEVLVPLMKRTEPRSMLA